MITRVVFISIALVAGHAIADDQAVLRFDPFEPKAQSVIETAVAPLRGEDRNGAFGAANTGNGQRGDGVGKAPTRETWGARLRGIVHSGPRSVVNVDGEMITINGEFDGYKLKSVKEREAVFVKNGNKYVLSLDEFEGEELEDNFR